MALAPSHQRRSQVLQKASDAEWVRIRLVTETVPP